MPASLARRQRRAQQFQSELVEAYAVGKLRIDKQQGVIYGVKLCGRFSKNNHGIPGVTDGTEYTRKALKEALPLYEGVRVFIDHLPRNKAPQPRGAFDSIGVIKGCTYDEQHDCPRGDLHYRMAHPRAAELIEDVEREMGSFGLSHHIPPGGYTGTVKNGRLVIESITQVKSVDLVDDPATTRNLWESGEPKMKTFRDVLREWVEDKSEARQKFAATLLEEDDMPMDASVDAPAAEADPEDELWAGFMSAIMAIINSDDDASTKAKKIGKYLKAHEKLTSDKEPAADDSDTEAEPKESRETHELKAKVACLEAGIKSPSPALLKALSHLDSEADRKALIEQTRAAQTTTAPAKRPVSGAPRPHRPALSEGKVPSGDAFRRSITG